MNKVKTALIGYGHLGKWHAQKIEALEDAEFVAIVEKFEDSQKKAKEAHPQVKIVSDLSEVLDEIDAAVIATPTSIHFQLTKDLLEAKKHVFCEKPLCSNGQEVEGLKGVLSEDLILQVGHSERCHEIWEKLKPIFNQLNEQSTIKLTRVAAFKGRATDVDVVQDLMIHDIDLILYLFNKTPKSVKAWGYKVRTSKWDDVTAEIEFADGSVALITASRNDVLERRDFQVTSQSGSHYVDLMNQKYYFATDTKFEDDSFVRIEDYQRRDHLLVEQKSFYKSILNKEAPMVTYQDAREVILLMDKISESLEKNERILL
jgi:predicted dehydrogenase